MYILDPYQHQNRLDIDLSFCACGYESCIPGNRVGPNLPDYYTFHFVVDGCGTVQTETTSYRLEAGDGFILYPNQIFYYTPDLETPWTYYWVGFNSSKAELLLEGISSSTHPIFHHDEESLRVAKTIYHFSKSALPLELKDFQFLSYLYELFYRLKTPTIKRLSPQSQQQRYLDYAISYISQSYHKELTVEEIADYIHIDRTYLYLLFKKAFGLSPKQYIIQYRLKKACYLLEHTDVTAKEIAQAVGYKDYSLFSRIFKKNKGLSPQNYRDQIQ